VNLWRLERARLLRTLRWLAVLGPFVLFGVTMPIVTRYQQALLRRFGGGVKVIAPPPTPPQAIAAYLQNAMQIGLVVSVLVAAGSLAFDAKPEWAAFLRTRAGSIASLVIPKVVTNALAIAAAFVAGLLAAWVGTRAFIGDVPVVALLGGGVLGALYLAFAVSLVAFAASLSRNVLGASGLTIVVLIVLPLLGQLERFRWWVPSALVGAPTSLAAGTDPLGAFVRPAIVTIVLGAALTWLAARRLERREI
jgi:ABC-2 type transport system permease protein